MAENHLKMRICRIFRSCKSKHYITDDVLDTHHHQLMEENPIFSPKLLPPPPHPFTINNNHRIITNNKTYSYYDHIFHPDGRKCPPASPIYFQPDGRKCPPASPIISPLNPKSTLLNKLSKPSRLYSTNSTKYHRGFDAFEEEDERNRGARRRNRSSSALRRRKAEEDEIMSLAVVKRSNDPYADFRVSMLEMIVQNQIFAAKDLRNLLRCFLALNTCHYHNLILQVFDEISQALLREL